MRIRRLAFALVFLALAAAAAQACSVPVFRYALERWPAERFVVYVFHKGSLAGDDEKLVGWMKACSEDANVTSNAEVWAFDVDKPLDAAVAAWKPKEGESLPRIVAAWPMIYERKEPLWSGPLTAENARAVLDSPARREIGRRILAGDAAVWVIVGDDSVEALVKTEIAKLARTLQLPELLEEDILEGAPKPNLAVAFSYVRVRRNDPAEAVFLAMLLGSDTALPADKPLVGPVFGQGRLLTMLAGPGITAENIGDIAQFLVGPCSCVVKEQNPGIDLLMSVNWSALPDGRWVKPQEMPVLTGLSAAVAPENATAQGSTPARAPGLGLFETVLAAAVAVILLIVVIVTVVVALRRPREEA